MKVVGFWASDATSGLSGLYTHSHAISDFAPFWYSVNASGGLVNRVDKRILEEVQKHKIPVTPLVNDETGTQAFLTSMSTRVNAARNIADMVKSMHFQGVNIDFEPAHTRVAAELTSFMADLRDYLPKGASITVDIVPSSGGAYDFAKISPEINQYILMSYDQHDDGSAEGPVAATPWVQNIVTRLEKTVPGSKIDLGVAAYGYSWPVGSTAATTIPYNGVTSVMVKHAHWDAADQETFAKFSTTSGPHIAWWESLQGMNEKIRLAKQDHLAGIAIWHLGYANNAVYELFQNQVGLQ